ncbi:MAG: outer membrane protein assembly factor BamA, partial [Colwellia sp.]|nr:outer membrane protein assembly factor BamA [Colwellia sp.]
EGAWLSNSVVESSKSWLMRLPYMETVEFETKQIEGEDDLVDIDFTVKEQPSGSFNAGIGYGSQTKLSVNAGIQQNNFLGTGNQLGFNIAKNYYKKSATISYTDPYFTVDAVSLGGQVYYSELDAGNANLVEYNNKTFGVGLNWGFPVNEYVRLNFGVGWKYNQISQLQAYDQIQGFYEIYADPNDLDGQLAFKTLDLNVGLSRTTLNRGTFPTSGSSQRLSAKMTSPKSDLQYFKLNYDAKFYFPLTRNQKWSVLTRLQLGYANGYGDIGGNDQLLPFWENFSAGGADTLRGFENNTVGPRAIYRTPQEVDGNCCLGPSNDSIFSTPRSVGGNAMALASLELIVPVPFLDESYANSVRTSIFWDAGNVWDTEFNLKQYDDLALEEISKIEDFSDPSRFRSSAGISIQWLSPMGPMIFSFAKPIREQEGDDHEFFSFNIGKTF